MQIIQHSRIRHADAVGLVVPDVGVVEAHGVAQTPFDAGLRPLDGAHIGVGRAILRRGCTFAFIKRELDLRRQFTGERAHLLSREHHVVETHVIQITGETVAPVTALADVDGRGAI